jgi:hypothetical protein
MCRSTSTHPPSSLLQIALDASLPFRLQISFDRVIIAFSTHRPQQIHTHLSAHRPQQDHDHLFVHRPQPSHHHHTFLHICSTKYSSRPVQVVLENRYNEDPLVRQWGLEVSPQMMRVEARVLPPPDLMYKNGQTVSRSPGKWNLTPPGRGPRVSYQSCRPSCSRFSLLM